MAAGAETVTGTAWGPLLVPAEHSGASPGVKTMVNAAGAQGTNSLKSILYLFGLVQEKEQGKSNRFD